MKHFLMCLVLHYTSKFVGDGLNRYWRAASETRKCVFLTEQAFI